MISRAGDPGIIMQLSENDLASPELRPYLGRYMRGHPLPHGEVP
jgi:hypothetical protein